ncbi:MAG: type II toxin-antitoxin system VapC family toxin [Desulfobacteraceae bacterium]|nr:type II toxin-antitoxin system VapC family toxin [Desulfobacteraceae bacterium]
MNKENEIYVFDTSALFTYLEDEEGSDYIDNLLQMAEHGEIAIYISFISLTEVYYITLQEKNVTEASNRIILIQSLAASVVESYETLNIKAGEMKSQYRISLADSFIAALCNEYNGTLVHKDPEFEALSSLIKEYRLPYKN